MTGSTSISTAGGSRRKWLAVIIAASAITGFSFFFLPLTYGSDAWRQADTASIARHFLTNGFRILYPQISWGGNGPGYVEAEFQLYPFIVALLYAALGEHLWLGRLVSLAFACGTLLLFSRLARGMLGERESLWATAFFAVSPLFIRYSVAFMPEATVLFFYVGALYFFDKWLDSPATSFLVASALMTSIAILVKPTAIHVGLVFALLGLRREGLAFFRRGEAWIAGIACLVPGTLWYLHARHLYVEYGNTFGLLSGGDSKFGTMHDWLSPRFYLALVRLEVVWVFAGAGLILSLAGIADARLKRRLFLLPAGVFSVLVYYMITARYSQEGWGIQYHIFALPFAALSVSLGMMWLLGKWKSPMAGSVLAASVLLTLIGSAVMYGRMTGAEGNKLGEGLIRCAADVERNVPPEGKIVVCTSSLAVVNGVPNNYQEPTIFFYSHRYGWSVPADSLTGEHLERIRFAGARYIVLSDSGLAAGNRPLLDYLGGNTERMGGKGVDDCMLFRFKGITEAR